MSRAALGVLLVLATAIPAAAGLFRWTSADGTIHYTGDLESIPEAYRESAVDVGAPVPLPEPPPRRSICCSTRAPTAPSSRPPR
jgi:hypothetical protein